MDQKWIQILLILAFYQKMARGAVATVVKEGDKVEIKCQPAEVGSMVIWFRVVEESEMEFIGSFSNTGSIKSKQTPFTSFFGHSKMEQHILTVKSFSRDRDSGTYSCASIKSNELKFGKVTKLTGEKRAEVVTAVAVATTQTKPPTTTTACLCPNNKEEKTTLSQFCSPLILGPVAGGCGLLLLLLVIAVLYCNRIRTRRCPHHHKRKVRMMAPQKQMMTNRHV
nr:T-cell surface glycoprotein CD8 alpha chain [Solea senegalensis]